MDVEALERAALAAVAAATSTDEIEAVRVEYLGRKSVLPLALREVRDAETGRTLNEAKRRIENAVAERADRARARRARPAGSRRSGSTSRFR